MNTAVAAPELSRLDLSTDAISHWLCVRIGAALQIDSAQIDPDITFDRYGLDSVQAIEVTAELGRALGLGELEPTLLYDYPTIQQLAVYAAALVRK
ncbi:acyl carrier protein [Oxalobacteraceae bacterium]|nr:acyl carrier protein [Oxalobacteraceae bacterium]